MCGYTHKRGGGFHFKTVWCLLDNFNWAACAERNSEIYRRLLPSVHARLGVSARLLSLLISDGPLRGPIHSTVSVTACVSGLAISFCQSKHNNGLMSSSRNLERRDKHFLKTLLEDIF